MGLKRCGKDGVERMGCGVEVGSFGERAGLGCGWREGEGKKIHRRGLGDEEGVGSAYIQ